MLKLWVIGANGMLGSHVERLLEKEGKDFIGKNAGRVDITDENHIARFVDTHRISHILNCAAYTQVDKAESEEEKAFQINAKGPENIGKIAFSRGIRVVHISTDYVFDGQSHQPYKEEHPGAPINAYGKSKWEGEKRLLEKLPTACIIRSSWLFGYPGKNFVDTILKLLQERETLRVVADQFGRPTYCADLAKGILDLLDQTGIFHFANANQTNWYHFAKEIHHLAKTLGFPILSKTIEPIPTSHYPSPAQRPSFSTLDTEKIEKLGIQPRPWQEALKEYLLEAHCLNPALNKGI